MSKPSLDLAAAQQKRDTQAAVRAILDAAEAEREPDDDDDGAEPPTPPAAAA
jgi:hypothetical protein